MAVAWRSARQHFGLDQKRDQTAEEWREEENEKEAKQLREAADRWERFTVAVWTVGVLERFQACRRVFDAELKGSIGEGPNHSNFSDQSSVKIQELLLKN